MFCYNLISCDAGSYPDIIDLCSDVRLLDDENKYILNFDEANIYQLVYTGDSCVCAGTVPEYYVFPTATNCGEAVVNNVLRGVNCSTGEVKGFAFIPPYTCDGAATSYDFWAIDTNGLIQRWDAIGDVLDAPILGGVSNLASLAVDNTNKIGYAIRLVAPFDVYSVDLTNPLSGWVFLGAASIPAGRNIVDLVFNPLDGLLYAVARTTLEFFSIDPVSLTTTLVNTVVGTPAIGSGGGGLAYDGNNDLYYAVEGKLYLIDLGAGTATGINPLALPGSVGALAWKEAMTFYLGEIANQISEYDNNTGISTVVRTGTITNAGGDATRNAGCLIRLNEDCSCWELDGEYTQVDVIVDDNLDFTILETDCSECATIEDTERTFTKGFRVSLPQVVEQDRGFKECCYKNLVLADVNSSEDWRNDYNSFYFKRQLEADTVSFILIDFNTNDEYVLNDGTYGQFWDFGAFDEQPDLSVYRVDWKKVLTLLGEGVYFIRKEVTIAGISIDLDSNTYCLEQFTEDIADQTIRIDSVMNGKLIHKDIDFKGTNFSTTTRVRGFFGNREATYTQDNLVRRDYSSEQISMSQENEYQLQTESLPECITEEVYDFHLFGDELYISDYNSANHSYKFLRFPVEFQGNRGGNYYANTRKHIINLTFTDRIKNKRKTNC